MALELGKPVLYEGRVLLLRGLDPMSVREGHADVEDPQTGELLRVPIASLAPLPGGACVLGETA